MQSHLVFHLFGDVVHDFGQPVMLWQMGALPGTLALAWGLAWLLRRALDLALLPLLGIGLTDEAANEPGSGA